MAVKGWRIIWIVICLFQPWTNQVDIALGMRRTHHNRCAHVQSVPSPLWGCDTKALFSPPSLLHSSSLLHPPLSHHTISPSWPLKWALPLLTNLPPSGPSCACAASISTPASREGQVRAGAEHSHVREPFCEDLWPRVRAQVLEHRVLNALSIVCMQILYPFIKNWRLTSTNWSVLFSVVYISNLQPMETSILPLHQFPLCPSSSSSVLWVYPSLLVA